MNAVEYLKIKERMTKNCSECYGCRLSYGNNGTGYGCRLFEINHPEQAAEIVEKWSKEHPVKTYLSVLLEKMPNIPLRKEDSVPSFCPHDVFKTNYTKCSTVDCIDCWNREYKEEI